MIENNSEARLPTPTDPVVISGEVVHGKMLGRQMGTPTANVSFDRCVCPVPCGIYASRVLFRGARYNAVTNIGTRPTVDGEAVNCETYIFDFSEDIYGQSIEITLYTRLREERRFCSVDELRLAILSDIEGAREFFASHSDI